MRPNRIRICNLHVSEELDQPVYAEFASQAEEWPVIHRVTVDKAGTSGEAGVDELGDDEGGFDVEFWCGIDAEDWRGWTRFRSDSSRQNSFQLFLGTEVELAHIRHGVWQLSIQIADEPPTTHTMTVQTLPSSV